MIVGGEPELALLLHIFPEGVEELDGAYAVYADEPPLGFDVLETNDVAEGWQDAWRNFHHGLRVARCWVGPPWEEPPADAIAVVIDPGRAFGTGAHATTRLCLELLQERVPTSLLDVGCGSGVLAIGAARLGYRPVTALDHDPAAIEATQRNAAANGVVANVRLADALAEPLPSTDVAVINISAEAVERLLPVLDARAIVTSGYLERDAPSCEGMRREGRLTEGGWAADVFRREE